MFGAERIGHGYRVIEDEDVYQMCLREDVHFEVCPHSSYLTGSIGSLTTKSKRHPVLRFVVLVVIVVGIVIIIRLVL